MSSATPNRYANLYRDDGAVRCLACHHLSDSIERHHRHLVTADHGDEGEAYL